MKIKKIIIDKKIIKRLFNRKIKLKDPVTLEEVIPKEEPEEDLFERKQREEMLRDQERELEFFFFHEMFHDLPQEEDYQKRGK